MDPLVSVIIPTYNREKLIIRSVESVLNQTYENLELIVVDDCSNDNTVDILTSVTDSRIRIVKLEKNSGACVARNRGIMEANGDYIAFQDSDDVWREEKLAYQMNAIKRYNADICVCQMERVGFREKNGIYPDMEDGIVEYKKIVGSFIASTQTIVAKREVFDSCKFDSQIKRMQDYDWIIRAASGRSVCAVRKPLVDVYLQQDSITTYNWKKLIDSYRLFLKKYENLARTCPEFNCLMKKCLAYALTLDGENTDKQYMELYKLTGVRKYLAFSLMARIHVLKMYFEKRRT